MNTVYLLQNQRGEFLSKQGEWVDGREAGTLFKTPHKDEALNQKVEVNSKDYTLRIQLLECEQNNRGIPLISDDCLSPLMGADETIQAESAISPTESLETEPQDVDERTASANQQELITQEELMECEETPEPEGAAEFAKTAELEQVAEFEQAAGPKETADFS